MVLNSYCPLEVLRQTKNCSNFMEWVQFQEILEELFPVGEVLAKPQSRPVRQNPNWLQFVWTDSFFFGLERQDACHETEIKRFLWTKKKVPESNFLHHYWPPSGCFYFLRIHSNWRWQNFFGSSITKREKPTFYRRRCRTTCRDRNVFRRRRRRFLTRLRHR